MRSVELAVEMLALGARAPVVNALLDLPKTEVAKLSMVVADRAPPRGMLPSDPKWYSSTIRPRRAVQSAFFANVWFLVRSQRKCDSPASHMLAAYKIFIRHFEGVGEEIILSFDRAWVLTRLLLGRSLVMVPCQSCNSHFVLQHDDLAHGYLCPFCRDLPSLRSPVSPRTVQ
jgi:flagellar transcriptional activator FlhC